jgi:hypothetical protein
VRDPAADMAELRQIRDQLDSSGRRQLLEVRLHQLSGGSLLDQERVQPNMPLHALDQLVVFAFEDVRLSDDPVRESGSCL